MELPWVRSPTHPPLPESEGQATAAQCPACSPQGRGQALPGSSEAGLALARSAGDGGKEGGKASLPTACTIKLLPWGTGTKPSSATLW